jgi:hypothetical protein
MITIPLTYEQVLAAHPDFVAHARGGYKVPKEKYRWGYGFSMALTAVRQFNKRKTAKGKRNYLLRELRAFRATVCLTAHIGGGCVWAPYLSRYGDPLPEVVAKAIENTDPATWQDRRH